MSTNVTVTNNPDRHRLATVCLTRLDIDRHRRALDDGPIHIRAGRSGQSDLPHRHLNSPHHTSTKGATP